MIIENVIKTCSCFIYRTIWFVNLSPKQVVNPWHFDLNCDIADIFIKDIQQTKIILDEKFIHKKTIIIIIIISCNDCFEFQLFIISLEENSMLDTLNCRFVTFDTFCYDDGYSSEIFTGNSQFDHENYFLSRKQRELLFRNADVKLAKCPLHKSCFISLQKKRYQFFCTTCKKAYNDFFEKNLHTFSSYFTKNE